MSAANTLAPLDVFSPAAWALGSVLLAVVVTNLTWLWRAARPAAVAGLAIWPGTPALVWLLRGLFLLLPPVLAWQRGALSLYAMGLTEIDWLAALALGGLLAALVVVLVLFGWLVYRRGLPADAVDQRGRGRWLGPVDAGLLQWHWAFYRAAAIGWLPALAAGVAGGKLAESVPLLAQVARDVTAQPIYWGTWLGLLLVGLEWALNPWARAGLRRPGSADNALRMVALAVATAALFSLTRNFWLCLACSLAVEIPVMGWFPAKIAPTQQA